MVVLLTSFVAYFSGNKGNIKILLCFEIIYLKKTGENELSD